MQVGTWSPGWLQNAEALLPSVISGRGMVLNGTLKLKRVLALPHPSDVCSGVSKWISFTCSPVQMPFKPLFSHRAPGWVSLHRTPQEYPSLLQATVSGVSSLLSLCLHLSCSSLCGSPTSAVQKLFTQPPVLLQGHIQCVHWGDQFRVFLHRHPGPPFRILQ